MAVYVNAILVLLAWAAVAAYVLINSRKIRYLKAVAGPGSGEALPQVAIIIPVRNEEENLRQALATLVDLDYPRYSVILVNDGSTDASTQIIDAFIKKYPQISCCHINSLPPHWIGKSYALYSGYQHSRAEWLLFTDADVRFKKESLGKAVAYCLSVGAAHLTILPHVRSRSAMVNCINAVFQLLLHLRYRPWAAADACSTAYMGMGAFNLVHRQAYEAIGTHERFALHPNDDLKLGEYIKQAGFRQHVLYGQDEIRYEWYRSMAAFINGLTKNAFSSVDYSVPRVLMSSMGAVLFFVLPVPQLMLSGNLVIQGIGVLVLLIQTAVLVWRRGAFGKWWYGLLLPIAALIIIFIMLRSAVLTLYHNGVYWSKRFYKLSELKKCR